MILKNYTYKKTKVNNWAEVFQNPCEITVRSIQTGTVEINKRGALNPNHPLVKDIDDEELEVPIQAYWVHHDEEGDFLLDTGIDASYITHPRGRLEGSAVDEFKLGKHENIAYHIQDHGIELKMVFLSHLHADHAAGLRELPNDIPYVISKGEFSEYHPEMEGDYLGGLDELYEIDFLQAPEIPPIGPSADLLGDGSLLAILTPGHTPGHMSFLVNRIDGPVLLSMDAIFINENLELGVAPSDYTWDVGKAQETLERIVEFQKKYTQLQVCPGHDAKN